VTSAAPPAEPFLATGGLAGDDALWSGDFAAGGPLGRRWRGLLGASYQQGLSYRDGDGRRQTELPGLNYQPAARDELAFAIRHAELHATWNGATGGVLALHAAGNDARQVLYPTLLMDALRDRSSRLGLSWSAPAARPLADRWRVAMHHERVEHDMSDALRTSSVGTWSARGYMMRTIAATTGAGFSAEAEVSRPAADFVYGGQLTHRNWIADNVVGPNSNRMLPDATTRQAGVFVQAERVAGAWKLKTGARVDAWRTHAARDIAFVQAAHGTPANTRCDMAPSGFVLIERRARDAALYAGLGHGARVPDPQERYIAVDRPGTGTDWVGNPALDVVRATEVTVGTRVHAGPGRLAARVFHSWLENYIVLQRLVPAAGSGANASRTESYGGIAADLTGAEIQADVTWAERWTLTMSAAGQRGQKRISSAAGSDRDLSEIPPWRGRVTLHWSQPAGWIEAELQWARRQNRLDADAGERPLPGYGVLHLRAERAFSKTFTLSLGMENLFDRTYATHNAYTRDPFAAGIVVNEPGRSAYAQARWRF
jgi:iron complex outermembrane receptor protein